MNDKGLNLAMEHLALLSEKNNSFNGVVVFCEKANEYVVNDITHDLHFHISDNEDLSDWELDLVKKHKELV